VGCRAAHANAKLNPRRLREEEGRELRELVDRWDELTGDERQRLERIVGTAAGNADLFQQRREQAEARAKIAALEEAERRSAPPRDARSGSVVAAPESRMRRRIRGQRSHRPEG
jgi:hypothetical protein